MRDGSSSRLLERTIARFRHVPHRSEPLDTLSAGAFRAVVDERLSNLERQLDELNARVNGLLFLIAGTVVTQIVIRLLG